MLEHAREARALIEGKSRSDLYTDRKLNLALVRLLEIVGEAASRRPKKTAMRILRYRGQRLLDFETD
jgi:uncharacterized protein with HEPN domain